MQNHSYQTGMLLWGTARSVANIWIVTDGPNRSISLVFDGKNKRYNPDFKLTKHDSIKPSSFLYELTDAEIINQVANYGPIPQWAIDFMKLRPPKSVIPAQHKVAPPNLTPAVVQKVQKALNVNLTAEPERVIVRKDETKCPVNGEHRFVPYTGLIQSFEYCVHCDKKRNMNANT